MLINAEGLHFSDVNRQLKESSDTEIVIDNALGHRYIGSGAENKNITINGTPGNALGAYLFNCDITVNGNAQDATGDTMNSGRIVIHGNCGDTTGYAMRGGEIYIKGNAGYRVGIHMKQYKEQKPVIVVGGEVGDFLGEYQAGGIIIILGLNADNVPVGNFCGTGMHGGKIYIRTSKELEGLPSQVVLDKVTDKSEITPFIKNFSELFETDADKLIEDDYVVLTPNTKNPYKQLYTHRTM